jgi:TolB-like protein
VQPFSAPSDPALGLGLANAISARLGGQQLISIQRMAKSLNGQTPPSASREEAGGSGTLVLEGEIRTSALELTVVVRLRDDASGVQVWSDRFQARADQFFSVEDVIAERVIAALELRLAAAEQERLRRRYTSNAAAYAEFLRGRAALVKYTPTGTREAIEAFERALAQDPEYALARAGLAMACADMYLRFAPASEVEQWGERTEAEARAALALNPDLAEAHLARAAVARKREFDWDAVVAASRRVLVLNPNLEQARFFMAAAYYHLGYMEEARIELEKGRALKGADTIEPVRKSRR